MAIVPAKHIQHSKELRLRKKVAEQEKTISLLTSTLELQQKSNALLVNVMGALLKQETNLQIIKKKQNKIVNKKSISLHQKEFLELKSGSVCVKARHPQRNAVVYRMISWLQQSATTSLH